MNSNGKPKKKMTKRARKRRETLNVFHQRNINLATSEVYLGNNQKTTLKSKKESRGIINSQKQLSKGRGRKIRQSGAETKLAKVRSSQKQQKTEELIRLFQVARCPTRKRSIEVGKAGET